VIPCQFLSPAFIPAGYKVLCGSWNVGSMGKKYQNRKNVMPKEIKNREISAGS
jgi:hypothetical protein